MICKSKTFWNYFRSNEIWKHSSVKYCANISAEKFYSANFVELLCKLAFRCYEQILRNYTDLPRMRMTRTNWMIHPKLTLSNLWIQPALVIQRFLACSGLFYSFKLFITLIFSNIWMKKTSTQKEWGRTRIPHEKFYLNFHTSLGYALEAAFEGLLWNDLLIVSENSSICFIPCRNTGKNIDLQTRSKGDRECMFKQQSWNCVCIIMDTLRWDVPPVPQSSQWLLQTRSLHQEMANTLFPSSQFQLFLPT